ncbi:hypothetical protein PUMCH_004745 [Australozyma saopauloensis]|uniref:Serine hydrolase domain-containing protein n=1 Tax=Australozyma saopauloensis TaxID=291208 RepID=A0AAX4HFI2_9ASCO|nr:hypothetical protein PUMCH_004745 [[Candida] saopauloensis]
MTTVSKIAPTATKAKAQNDFVGRVLFIHGYTQNAHIFHSKTLAFRKKLISMKLKPIYLNGPTVVSPAHLHSQDEIFSLSDLSSSDSDNNCRSWCEQRSDAKYSFEFAKDTVKNYIENGIILEGSAEDKEANLIADFEVDKDLPIVGLVGFSQGAAFSAAMVDKFEEHFGVPRVKWAILYSGYMFDIIRMPEHKKLFSTDKGLSSNPTRMLHVLGELDTVVSEERSMQLFDFHEEISTMLRHPGGHFVPNSRPFVEKVCNWIVTENEPQQKPEEKVKDEKSDLDSLLDMMKGFGG